MKNIFRYRLINAIRNGILSRKCKQFELDYVIIGTCYTFFTDINNNAQLVLLVTSFSLSQVNFLFFFHAHNNERDKRLSRHFVQNKRPIEYDKNAFETRA